MTITGIVAEFNPFHNGHAYLLNQLGGLKIVVMSGNFVQRGEPAIVDKWTRTQMALNQGADLVVEMPFLVSVQSADYFAQGALEILSKLGIEKLVFGSEEIIDYQRVSDIYGEKAELMEAYIRQLDDSLTYPQKTQKMWQAFAGLDFAGDTPNHILGLAYAKACAAKNIQLEVIKREGANYHSTDKTGQMASATAIRRHLDDKEFLERVMPDSDLFLQASHVSWADYFPLLRYQIMTHWDLTSIFQVNEELASRIRTAIRSVATIDQLVEKVATKRYTKARVRRVLTYILVNASEAPLPDAVHILGFSAAGQAHLKSIKTQVDMISRIGAKAWDLMSQQADKVYQMGNPKLIEQNYGRVPVREKK
ncbi:hypothetical protein BI362_05840 [Streptococcus parauberis]|nr:hypothetical protein BI362_05840 [Streptococcus parauberis]